MTLADDSESMLLQGAVAEAFAGAAGDEELEKPELRIAFLPQLQAAPLIVAKERGFFRRHGLDVSLVRGASCASVHADLASGVLDGAQLPAPAPLAATLGIGTPAVPMLTALAFGRSGGAITVSSELYRRMRELDPPAMAQQPVPARALAQVLDDDRRRGRAPLVFADISAFSSQGYALRYWLASGGVASDQGPNLRIVSPGALLEDLARGVIDGYCAGEPCGANATRLGIGRAIVAAQDIWRDGPEDVLAVTHEWATRHPRSHRAVLRALIEAASWIDRPENQLETAHVIAGESHLDVPVEVIESTATQPARSGAERKSAAWSFYRGAASFPWRSHAVWFLTQMQRWGQAVLPLDVVQLARSVYRTDLYREAARDLGVSLPPVDAKCEGAHRGAWLLEGSTGPIAMESDAFLDGREFDPDEPLTYLAGFAVAQPTQSSQDDVRAHDLRLSD